MTIILTADQERILLAQMATGRFRSVEEVLDMILSPLELRQSDVPAEEGAANAQAAAERIRELRLGVTLDRPEGISLREYAHLGHKY